VELQERRRQIEDHGRHLRARLDEIHRQHSEREQELRLLQGLEAFCDGIRDTLIDPPFDTKQKVLRLVIDRVIVEADMLVIRHVVPTAPIRLQPHPRQAGELRGSQARGDPYAGFPSAVPLEPLPASPSVEHRKHKGVNNRAENSHQPTRQRERQTKRFKSPGQAQRFLSAHDGINNLFLLRRHQVPAAQYRAARTQTMQVWAEVSGVTAAA